MIEYAKSVEKRRTVAKVMFVVQHVVPGFVVYSRVLIIRYYRILIDVVDPNRNTLSK